MSNYPPVPVTINGQTYTINSSSGDQYDAALSLEQAASNDPGSTVAIDDSSAPLVDLPSSVRNVGVFGADGHIVEGANLSNGSSDPVAVLLDGKNTTFVMNGTDDANVTSYDDANTTVINNNADGNLNVSTGSGTNVLDGYAGVNSFTVIAQVPALAAGSGMDAEVTFSARRRVTLVNQERREDAH